MFEKWVQAQAVILDDEGSGAVVDTDLHGVDWDHHKYIVEVRPAGEPPFRAETKAKVPIFSSPDRGDTVTALYEPKHHKVEIVIEGDPRYDPKLIRERRKQEQATRAQALLGGAPVPAPPAAAGSVEDDGEPRWIVPETCPECGARVDQSTASMAEHPMCSYCEQPLPCEPA